MTPEAGERIHDAERIVASIVAWFRRCWHLTDTECEECTSVGLAAIVPLLQRRRRHVPGNVAYLRNPAYRRILAYVVDELKKHQAMRADPETLDFVTDDEHLSPEDSLDSVRAAHAIQAAIAELSAQHPGVAMYVAVEMHGEERARVAARFGLTTVECKRQREEGLEVLRQSPALRALLDERLGRDTPDDDPPPAPRPARVFVVAAPPCALPWRSMILSLPAAGQPGSRRGQARPEPDSNRGTSTTGEATVTRWAVARLWEAARPLRCRPGATSSLDWIPPRPRGSPPTGARAGPIQSS